MATWESVAERSVASQQAGTETPPAADAAREGIDLTGIASITFWVDAGAGETITADTGQLDLYQHDGGLWGCVPASVQPIPPGASGNRRVQIGTVVISNPRGWLAAFANGISVSGASLSVEMRVTKNGHLGGIPA